MAQIAGKAKLILNELLSHDDSGGLKWSWAPRQLFE